MPTNETAAHKAGVVEFPDTAGSVLVILQENIALAVPVEVAGVLGRTIWSRISIPGKSGLGLAWFSKRFLDANF